MNTVIVRNISGEAKVWCGKPLANGESYTIPNSQTQCRWASNDAVLESITGGELQVNDGEADVSGHAAQIEWLTGYQIKASTTQFDRRRSDSKWFMQCFQFNIPAETGWHQKIIQFPYDLDILSAELITWDNNEDDRCFISCFFEYTVGAIQADITAEDNLVKVSETAYGAFEKGRYIIVTDGTHKETFEVIDKEIDGSDYIIYIGKPMEDGASMATFQYGYSASTPTYVQMTAPFGKGMDPEDPGICLKGGKTYNIGVVAFGAEVLVGMAPLCLRYKNEDGASGKKIQVVAEVFI